METDRMNRRAFIFLSAVGISALGAGFSKVLHAEFRKENSYARPRVLSQLCDDDTIESIGRAYLESDVTAKDRHELMRELCGRPINADSLGSKDLMSIQAHIENSIKRDFETRNTLVLRGWVLSLTEARQCALYTILNV